MNRITQLLGIKYPIFQGAMAQISRASLVAAVSNAGGLGILASGGLSAEEVREEIKVIKAHTDKPFAVNLMLMEKNIPDIIQVLIEEGVRIVTTGAGTPKPYMPTLKEHDFIVIPVIPNVKVAKKMEDLGCHALVAEGMEAGGHIGSLTTMALTRQVTEAVSIPVLAAGGIADGHGIVAAHALGAEGVQIGTLFLASEECPIPLAFKEKVVEANDTDTVITGRLSGHPVRGLRNKLTDDYLKLEAETPDLDALNQLTDGALYRAVKQADMETGSLMAGQISGLVSDILPVQVIVDRLVAESQEVLNQLKIN